MDQLSFSRYARDGNRLSQKGYWEVKEQMTVTPKDFFPLAKTPAGRGCEDGAYLIDQETRKGEKISLERRARLHRR